jgi:Sec-independent protein secretion pathway component TatC
MDKAALVKKLGLYTLLFVSGTLFVYFVLTTAMFPYSAKLDSSTTSTPISTTIGVNLFLPILYAFLSLIILGLVQFALIKPDSLTEKRISAIAVIFFFGLSLGLSLVVFILACMNNGLATIIGSIPALVVSLAEVVYGILRLLEANKALANEAKAQENSKA